MKVTDYDNPRFSYEIYGGKNEKNTVNVNEQYQFNGLWKKN